MPRLEVSSTDLRARAVDGRPLDYLVPPGVISVMADRRSHALMQANNVQVVKADAKFVDEVKSKVAGLEAKWVTDAEAKGLKDARKVLAEFRAEIAKQEK